MRLTPGTFFASNFVDPGSAAWMTIEAGGTVLGTSEPITGEDFGQFGPPNIALPPGTTELTVRIHAIFGPNESASFYAAYVLIQHRAVANHTGAVVRAYTCIVVTVLLLACSNTARRRSIDGVD